MSLYPDAVRRLLPENKTQRAIKPRAVIVHSAAGRGSLYGWWQNTQSKGLECHFWVAEDGTVEQYIDTQVRADANGEANSYAVSIETESSREATERWTPPQAAALVRLVDWLCSHHQIPRKIMTSPTGSGLAWHVQFGAPGPWTPSRGKTCPGPARIEQFKNEIVPAVAKPAKPLVAPKWHSFAAGATDHTIRRSGGLDHQVSEVQLILNHLGFDAGTVDGDYGPKTRAAVRAFKRWIQSIQKATGQDVWPNDDTNVGPKTIGMLRWWNKAKA